MTAEVSHIAFSDESKFNIGRFRSIGMVSCSCDTATSFQPALDEAIRRSGISEFKWEKLRQARDRLAAIAMLDVTMSYAKRGVLRVDTLIWDTWDSRHRINRRDDIANLQRMYYHLFKNVLHHRWPSDAAWCLHPDEHSAMDWDVMSTYLQRASSSVSSGEGQLAGSADTMRSVLQRDFRIASIQEVCSHEQPLCQLADLFAGLGAYSYSLNAKYRTWLSTSSDQLSLAFIVPVEVTNSERERFEVISTLERKSGSQGLGIGGMSSGGLRTFDPVNPVNFWLYVPQSSKDQAPVRPDEVTP